MALILILGIIFLLLLVGITLYVKQKVEKFSRQVFGTNSITEGFQKVQEEYVATPKSVSGMTSLYLPNIMKDFPDFHYDEMRERAEHVLVAYLLSIHEGKLKLPDYVNSDLSHQLEQHLQMLSNKNQKEHFTSVKLHDCQLSSYSKVKGKCKVTFQASVQYYHYIEDNMRKVLSGSKTTYEQTRYEIDLIYIQNRELVDSAPEDALGINCPNCGAPITSLGHKYCEYCGSSIVALNINTWSFSDVIEKP
ncbi:MAG: zinc ribbon domain-containing protein [Eubacteriales bacterium]